jgi:alpha-1,3-rhamnosyl/mannosyltransferase
MANSAEMDNTTVARPVRLGLDATSAARPSTGVGHYTRSLLAALARRADVDLWPFTHGLRSRLPLPGEARRAPARLKLPGKLLLLGWHHLRRPCVDRLAPRAEVLFSPNYLLLPTHKPLLVTVHDLYFLDGPGQDWWSGGFLAAHLRRHLERRAALVLSDSEAMRRRILERFPGLDGRVKVLYPGVRERYRRRAAAAECAELRRRLGLPEAYLACVGEVSVRKNQMLLLDALRLARSGRVPPLVLCGLSPKSLRRVLTRAQEIGLAPGRVLALPYLDESQLHRLLSGALGLVCPSLDEGFGLTVLEAFALGIPVACSGAGALREVSGGKALYFDPMDPEAAAEAMQAIAGDAELRDAQASAGPAWASRFCYEAAAERLCVLAREVVDAGRA